MFRHSKFRIIGENLKNFISTLNCCNATTYGSQEKFCFLPAHRKFLIGLPSKVQSIKVTEKGKSKRVQLTQSNSEQNIDAGNVASVDPLKSIEVLQTELLAKLRDFGKTNGLVAIACISQTNIKNMEIMFGVKFNVLCVPIFIYADSKTMYGPRVISTNIFARTKTGCHWMKLALIWMIFLPAHKIIFKQLV